MNASPYDLRNQKVWEVCSFKNDKQSRWISVSPLMVKVEAEAFMKRLQCDRPNGLLGVRLKKEAYAREKS